MNSRFLSAPVRIFLTVASLAQVLPACAIDYRQLNSDGITALRSGDLPQAELLFNQALKGYEPGPDKYDLTIKSNLAVLYRKMGKNDQASALETEVASAEGKSAVAPSKALTDKDFIAFGQTHLDEIVSAKLHKPTNVMLTSASVMKHPGGNTAVQFNGFTGEKMVAVEMIMTHNLAGEMSIAGSTMQSYIPTAIVNPNVLFKNRQQAIPPAQASLIGPPPGSEVQEEPQGEPAQLPSEGTGGIGAPGGFGGAAGGGEPDYGQPVASPPPGGGS